MDSNAMQLALAEVDRAIREIRVWDEDLQTLADHKAVVYTGQNLAKDGEASGTWRITVVVYPAPGHPDRTYSDGAATHSGQGLVVRLTPELSAKAAKLALAAQKARPAK